MVVGIDTYHDSAKKGRSVAGYVASMNKSLTRYYSRVAFQHNSQELIDGLVVCTKGIIAVVLLMKTQKSISIWTFRFYQQPIEILCLMPYCHERFDT